MPFDLIPQSLATSFYPQAFPRSVSQAPNIVRGTVRSLSTQWAENGPAGRSLFTYAELDVQEILKATTTLLTERKEKQPLKVRQPGGEKDGVGLIVPGAARFKEGEDTILFLGEPNSDQSFDVQSLMMGKFQLIRDARGEIMLSGPGLETQAGVEHLEPSLEKNGVHSDSYASSSWSLAALRQLIKDQKNQNDFTTSAPVQGESGNVLEGKTSTAPPLQSTLGEGRTSEPHPQARGNGIGAGTVVLIIVGIIGLIFAVTRLISKRR